MPTELSDSEVFGAAEMSDAEVFGAREWSDQEAGLTQPPGEIAGTVNEFKRGLLTGQQALVAAQLEAAPKAPTMRQLRKGYVTAMSNPRYQTALTDAGTDPARLARVEETLGPTAQVGRVESAIRLNRQFIAEDVAKLEAKARAIPSSEAMTEWNNADNSTMWKVLARNPVEIAAGVIAQSFPQTAPALAANMIAPGGPIGRAIATGAGSYTVENANAFLDSARQTGYDFTDPVKVEEFFSNPQAQAKAKAFAIKRGVPIAIFDAITAGLAGKFIAPALRGKAGNLGSRVIADVAVQPIGGMAGEAVAQKVSGQPFDLKAIVAEGLGELGGAPIEIYSNLRQGRAGSPLPAAPGTSAPGRPVDDELPPAPPSAQEFLSKPGQSDVPLQGEAATGADKSKTVPGAAVPTAAAPGQSGTLDVRPKTSDSPPAPVPEDPRTIAAQMQMLVDGKRSAVLITEGEAMPTIPEGDRFATVELEGYGTMIYNKRLHKEETILLRAKEDKLGRILGFGVDRKPKPGTEVGVVTVRDPEGVEKQAVVTDEKNLPAVTKAAEKIAEPADTVQLETAEAVIEGRAGTPLPAARDNEKPGAHGVTRPTITPRHLAEARAALETERPPSVHDDIEGIVTTGPVRFPEADFRDLLDTVRDELAQKQFQKPYKKLRKEQRAKVDGQHRISVSSGMAADEVLLGIARENPKYEDWSLDDLAEALARPTVQTEDSAQVKALAEEIAQAEVQAAPANEAKTVTDFEEAAAVSWADKIDQALTRQIEASDPWQQQRSGELHLFGLPKFMTVQAYNGLVRIIRATFRGTRNLAQAIQAGIEWLRAQNLPDFSETEIKAWLAANVTVTPNDDDINIREFSDQLEADQPLPPDPARMVANLLYDRRTNESDAAFAARVMQAVGGPAAAVDVFIDATNGLPGSVRMFLGQLIIKAYGVTGQHEAAAIFYDNTFAAHVTETAQALQSLNAFLALTPEGKVIWAMKKIQRAANALVEPVQPQLDAAKQELDAANAAGIEETTAAPDVQDAARQAVDTALEKQAQTPGTELQEAIRAEVLDQLVKAGLLTAREAEIFRLHLEGTADNSTLAQKLERAGIPMHDKRADAINQLYKAKTKTEREKIKSRARKARQQQTAKEAAKGDESAIDLAIKRAMKDLRVMLGTVIREHHTKAEAVGKSLAEKIAAASGLSEADAKKLAEAVEKRFAAIITDRKKAALEKLLKPVKRFARPTLIERLIALSNLGALTQEQFWNAVKAQLDLPAWSNELAERIRKQVDVIERIPEDQIERKQKAQTELLNTIERAKGIDFFDLGLAFYKTNLLTGITTTVKNVASTFQNVMLELPVQLIINPSVAADWLIMAGEIIKEGSTKGVQGALDNWQSGILTGSRIDKVQAGRTLEQARFGQRGGVPLRGEGRLLRPFAGALRYILESDPGLPYLAMWKPTTLTGNSIKNLAEVRLMRFLNAWKFVTRGLGSQDMIFFKPVEEARAGILALRAARTLGLKGEAARDHARQVLGYGAKAIATAKAQAEAEGLTGPAAARRTAEILNANRPLELREDARQFAMRATFNNEPYGVFGWFAAKINEGKTHESPLIRVASNLMFPFTDVIANVINAQLNYTPAGAVHALFARRSIMGQKLASLTPDQQAEMKRELYVKALLGTTLLVAFGMKLAQYLDDDDPELAIYGAGPENPNHRKGLEAKKWIPHSLKVGDQYYSFATSPLAIPLAWLGNYQDRLRDARLYKNKSAERVAKDLPLMMAGVAAEGALVVTEQSFLTGMMQMTDILEARSAEQRGRALLKLGIRSATSGVIPNGVRQVDRYFDPQVYEQRTSEGILVNNIPFVRGEKGQPSLNALGLPITRPLGAQFTSSQADAPPLVKFLAESGNWPTMPDRNHIYPRTGRTMSEAEYYEFVKGSGALAYDRLEKLRATGALARYKDDATRAKVIAEYFEASRKQWRSQNGW